MFRHGVACALPRGTRRRRRPIQGPAFGRMGRHVDRLFGFLLCVLSKCLYRATGVCVHLEPGVGSHLRSVSGVRGVKQHWGWDLRTEQHWKHM